MQSFEPGEDWFWNYEDESFYDGPTLAPPEHHPRRAARARARPGGCRRTGVAS